MNSKISFLNSILFSAVLLFFILKIISEVGFYIYPIDDAYIHLSIAKHFAQDGVWGITSESFSSSTSSPLYTFLLAACTYLFGVWDYYPLVINVIVATGIFYFLHEFLKENTAWIYLVITLCITWFTPLYLQVLMGMEHGLHILLILLLCRSTVNYIGENKEKYFYQILIYAAISTMVRYETLFLVCSICLILLLLKKVRQSLLLALISFVPVAIYGLISLYNDSFFLPNGLLLKGNTHLLAKSPGDWINLFYNAITHNLDVFVLVTGMVITIALNQWKNKFSFQSFIRTNYIQLIALTTIFLHTTFARFGHFFRYEPYLMVMAFVAIIPLVNKMTGKLSENVALKSIILGFVLTSGYFLSKRLIISGDKMVKAPVNIFHQQYQTASFLHKYYNNSSVVANDIGAITYYSDIKLLDLYGLGSKDIVALKRAPGYNAQHFAEFVDNFTHSNRSEIAVLYEHWYVNRLPRNFIKVAEWRIRNNVVCASNIVAFYAIGVENEMKLRASIKDFQASMNLPVAITFF